MTSHHVTCHVTAISHASSSLLKRKEKEKEIQKKRNIKSRKIDKREILVSKVFHNICNIPYIVGNSLMSTFQCKFDHVNPSSYS